MASGKPGGSNRENDAKIVDRLLRELRFADPDLAGRPAGSGNQRAAQPGQPAAGRPGAAAKPPPSPGALLAGTWGRVALAVALAAGLTQWPYARDCGLGLFLYLSGVTLALATAAWGCVISWRRRVAPAHVVALLALLGAIVLGAERVLPRVGYAKASAGWSCGR